MSGWDGFETPDIFDSLGIGVTIHDPETAEILGVNEAQERMYGYTAEELREMKVTDYSADRSAFSHERVVRQIRDAASGEPHSFEWHVKRKNGELLWVHVVLNAGELSGRKCVIATIRDITALKERERRLRLLYRVLRHNLRNDMTVILGYSDELVQAVENEDLEAQLRIIRETADRVASLSEAVEEIERITDRDVRNREPVELLSVAEKAANTVRDTYEIGEITVDGTAGLFVNADDGLQTALEHAIENAVKHNDRESPNVSVVVSEGRVPTQVQLDVKDDGPGIPDIEAMVFENEEKISQLSHSTGLGVWIIKFCIESLGGAVTYLENEPRGSNLRITLPKVSERVPQ